MYVPRGGMGCPYKKHEAAIESRMRVLMMIAKTTGPNVLIV